LQEYDDSKRIILKCLFQYRDSF